MGTESFAESALWELWWVVVLIGGPALAAVLWEQHKRRQDRKNAARVVQMAAMQGMIERRKNPDRRGNVTIVPTQKQKDDKIFKVVEEHNNESH